MAATTHYDIVIRNALLIDGTGAPGRLGDLAVAGGKIVRIEGADAISPARGRQIIEAEGQALAPGFIDAHTHDDRAVIDTDMLFKISQGVTTVVVGNCGLSLSPLTLKAPLAPLNLMGGPEAFQFPYFADYKARLDRTPPSVNVMALIGHGTLRVATMDDATTKAGANEVKAMRALLTRSLREGASGFSTGLYYPFNAPADADEVTALAELLPEHGGIYATHMRDEADYVLDSLAESFGTAARANTPVVISHHKCAGPENWGRSRETLPIIEAAARRQPVGLDAYPYNAASTVLDPRFVRDNIRTVVASCTAHPEHSGRDLADIARDWGCTRREAAERLQPASAIYYSMDEEDVRRILAFPLTMIGSDGLPTDGRPHPRLWGTFPRVLGHYARDVGLFSLEEAVRKMTGLTAGRFGLADRGLLREGYAADLVLFDPETIIDTATFDSPVAPAEGVAQVIVNGVASYTPAGGVAARAGKIVRGRQLN